MSRRLRRTAGGAGKVVLAAAAAGADPSASGASITSRIRARYASGRYGATAYDQAPLHPGAARGGRPVPSAALRAALAGRARAAGLRPLGAGGDSVDATSLVIEALQAASVPRGDRALAAAAGWILAQRNRECGLASAGGGGPTEANSTAGAIRALRALGGDPRGDPRGAALLQERDGGVRFTAAVEEAVCWRPTTRPSPSRGLCCRCGDNSRRCGN